VAEPFSTCYLNGEYLPLREARISPLDRGFLFGDSVYEVVPVFDSKPFLFQPHFDRLTRSLGELRIVAPYSLAEWHGILERLMDINGIRSAYIYLQVTRGMEFGRNHAFPSGIAPTVFAMASPLPELTQSIREHGLAAITVEDFRWGRCDIKATTLLANVLMKQAAADAGAQEAIIVSNGEVLEGSSSSVFTVINGQLITPPNSRHLLPGTTREAALQFAPRDMSAVIRSISVAELRQADEIWIAAATRDVIPVCRLDGIDVGSGRPGPLWKKMSELFIEARSR
jgi:D-alanine transaminase